MNTHFLFADEAWLWAIPALLILGGLLWMVSLWVGRRRLARFISPKIAAKAAVPARRRRLLEFSVKLAVLLLLAVALARPLTGPRTGTAERSGIDLVIALDISKSMLVEDVAPSRLGAVKQELREWLKTSAGDRIGVVPFAGDAFVIAPLTFDYEAIDFVLKEVGPHSITAGGTNIASAIETAAMLLKKDRNNARVILLVSDGENLDGDAVAAARKAYEEDRITVLTVGVGTLQGGKVPMSDYAKYENLPPEKRPKLGFVKNEYGTVVESRIDERSLRSISGAAGGRYYLFAPGADTFRTLQKQSLLPLAQRSRARHLDVSDYFEWFQIPLACAVLLMAAGSAQGLFRRKPSPAGAGVPVVQPENYSPPDLNSSRNVNSHFST